MVGRSEHGAGERAGGLVVGQPCCLWDVAVSSQEQYVADLTLLEFTN